MRRIVAGVFHDKKQVTEAVDALLAKSVPVDEISVALRDQKDVEVRSIPVREDAGASRGAAAGGVIGASLGAVGITLVATGAAIIPGVSLIAAGPILMLFVGGTTLTGMAIGAPLGLGHWHGVDDMSKEELEGGSVLVAVHSDDLADLAMQVLAEHGAAVSEGLERANYGVAR